MKESAVVDKIKKMSFEEAMSEMERTVKSLEEGNLSLDESLEKFEYGIKLSGFLHGKLKSAEMRISELIKESGEIVESKIKIDVPETGSDSHGGSE